MKRNIVMVILTCLVILAGCAANTEKAEEQQMKLVEVDVKLPEDVSLNEQLTFEAELSQGGEAVEDADEVLFEIWKANEKEQGVKVKASHTKNGLYTAENTIKEKGVYYIQTHVTARSMHVMPKKQFTAGDVTKEEIEAAAEETENENNAGHSGDHDHH
ncbi:FixH family protein [Metabacillus indicus]|uniref:FixH family protein n=1 Tax=Metabacillus indicus TaxID=246786 RepID=UPI003CED9CF1